MVVLLGGFALLAGPLVVALVLKPFSTVLVCDKPAGSLLRAQNRFNVILSVVLPG